MRLMPGGESQRRAASELPRREAPLILLVDDYQTNRDLYSEYLSYYGFVVAEATDGLDAIRRARALLPDLIVMDLGLPLLDGWQAIGQLKADVRTRSIPIVVVTGFNQKHHEQAARKAGCDAFLLKPCITPLLVEIRRLLGATIDGDRRP